MDKPIKIFRSFAEAERADREYYRSLTPSERIQILLMLRKQHYGSDEIANKFQRVCRIIKRSEFTNDRE